MLNKFRLPLKNNKYTYIYAKAKFTDRFEIHILDRLNPKSSISILETIKEVQVQILKNLGIEENVLQFLKDSKWVLYGKNGEVKEYRFGELIDLHFTNPLIDEEIVEKFIDRIGNSPLSSTRVSKQTGKKEAALTNRHKTYTNTTRFLQLTLFE